MRSVQVALSGVADGSMYQPTDQTNQAVIEARRAWLAKQDITPEQTVRLRISYNGTDYCKYRVVDHTDAGKGMEDGDAPYADALVTTTPDLALFLPVADCVATTIYDEVNGVLMLSHLGRHSLEQQGGRKSVEFLQHQYGSEPETLKVWLGPAPGKAAYPIHALNGKGMKEAVFAQLAEAGIDPENIIDTPADTTTDPRYFSYSEFLKGNKPEGRFAMVAVMRAAP